MISNRLTFGSTEAATIIKKNRQLDKDAARLLIQEDMPMKSWIVEMTFTTDRSYTIEARTAEEAMELGENMHGGEAYDAWEKRK